MMHSGDINGQEVHDWEKKTPLVWEMQIKLKQAYYDAEHYIMTPDTFLLHTTIKWIGQIF